MKAGHYGGGLDTDLARPIIKFPLTRDALAPRSADDIEKVVLRVWLHQNYLTNMPPAHVVDVYSSQTEAANVALATTDFANSNYTFLTEWSSITPTSPEGAWYEVDVTDAVLTDLSNDVQDESAGSCFRVQIRDDLSLTNVWDNDWVTCVFKDNQDAGLEPRLRILYKTTPNPYIDWAKTFRPANVSVPSEDYDLDGADNYYEYVFGGNPTNASDTGIPPEFNYTGSGLEFVHAVRGSDTSLTYSVETTTDLVYGEWTNIVYAISGTNGLADGMTMVTNLVDDAETKRYIRVKVD
jgi:hypothetical protein